MKQVRVFERQVITYSWVVEIADDEDPDGAIDSALAGVPDGAQTERFSSENWVEEVQS